MSGVLNQTPLHAWHSAHGGRMVDFAGWSMPVQYGSIIDEHQATRTAVGLFDVSHMGRLRVDGPGGAALLDRLLTRKVIGLGPGKIRYSLVCKEDGGILDDVLIYHLREPQGDLYHHLVVNASNREKIVNWFRSQMRASDEATLVDQTLDTAMIAVQGPGALRLLEPLVGADLGGLAYYSGAETSICGHRGLVSRTGYTGEDGCELIVPAAHAVDVWTRVLEAGKDQGARAVGLAARDTLRLEAAMPLYGHELSENLDPLTADLAFAVNLSGRDFIGREALLAIQAKPNRPRRVGLELAGRRIPREHYPIVVGGERVGEVTSGTFSPTLQKSIAMAYVQPQYAELGTEVAVDIRGSMEPAKVVKLPFYYSRAK
ncbi:glycine cleavage system aminomethyltransferase GcvT [Anatilimnocola sp. NA78]|uniref:glycine cleavage system aminomethyltransferase GcvT n=1 Tax=Anatilimnocola sp. NA78 TaxID=3415683 RepID=UPI003CE45FA9